MELDLLFNFDLHTGAGEFGAGGWIGKVLGLDSEITIG